MSGLGFFITLVLLVVKLVDPTGGLTWFVVVLPVVIGVAIDLALWLLSLLGLGIIALLGRRR